jgi:hypothetical protein
VSGEGKKQTTPCGTSTNSSSNNTQPKQQQQHLYSSNAGTATTNCAVQTGHMRVDYTQLSANCTTRVVHCTAATATKLQKLHNCQSSFEEAKLRHMPQLLYHAVAPCSSITPNAATAKMYRHHATTPVWTEHQDSPVRSGGICP